MDQFVATFTKYKSNIRKGLHPITLKLQKPYIYQSLPPGNYFRYLVLQPGVGDEPLVCDLHISELGSTSFEAISYVWGSDVKDREITCNGRTIKITTNLFIALRNLRRDTPRSLWADSICINQDDLEEKGLQVAAMGQIYRLAQHTLIFIGPNDLGRGEDVRGLLEEVAELLKSGLGKFNALGTPIPYPDEGASILTDKRWKSFECLLKQKWFERGWVRTTLARYIIHILTN